MTALCPGNRTRLFFSFCLRPSSVCNTVARRGRGWGRTKTNYVLYYFGKINAFGGEPRVHTDRMALVPAAAAAVAAHSQKSMLEICPISSLLPLFPLHCHSCTPAVIVVVVIVSSRAPIMVVQRFLCLLSPSKLSETSRVVGGRRTSGFWTRESFKYTKRHAARYYYSTCNTHLCTTHTCVHVHNVFTNVSPKCVVTVACWRPCGT